MPALHRSLQEPRRVSSRSSWLLRFATAMVLYSLAMEFVLRFFLWSPAYVQRHPRLGSVGRPNAWVARSDEGWSRGYLDANGHNDRPPSGPVDSRVVVIGDSFTQATHVPFDANYCALTEAEMPGVEIINAGVAGRSPAHVPAVLEEYDFREVDVVVIQISEFDAEEMLAPHRLHLARSDTGEWEVRVPSAFNHYSTAGRAKMWLMTHSALLNAIISRTELLLELEHDRLRDHLAAPPSPSNSIPDDGAPPPDRARSAMDHVVDHVRRSGAQPLLLFIPEVRYTQEGLPVRRPAHREFWQEYAETRDIVFVDPTHDFRELFEERIQPSHGFHNSQYGRGHMNRHGHRITARILTDALREILP